MTRFELEAMVLEFGATMGANTCAGCNKKMVAGDPTRVAIAVGPSSVVFALHCYDCSAVRAVHGSGCRIAGFLSEDGSETHPG